MERKSPVKKNQLSFLLMTIHLHTLFLNVLENLSSSNFWTCIPQSRGWFEPWPRTSWQGAKEPELAILKYEMILSFQSIWLILGKYDHLWFWVTGIWAPTFLVKVVTHKLYFSGVTAFSSLSADLRSRLKPPSGLALTHNSTTTFSIWWLRARAQQKMPKPHCIVILPST